MLNDRIVLVTGASRGIGAATAKRLAAHGAAVAVNYHASEDAARGVVDDILRSGGRAMALRADVRDGAAVRNMVEAVERKLGPVDTLVVNAAISFPVKPFAEYGWEEEPPAMKQAIAGMTPLGRIGAPEDVAGAVLLAASDATRFVTGAYLPVCGGALML